MPLMVNNICEYIPRTELIIELTKKYRGEGRNILILTDRRGHLECIFNYLDGYSKGYYIGGMKQNDLKASETKQIIVATYSMAAEALDIKTLTTLSSLSLLSIIFSFLSTIFVSLFLSHW